MARSSTSGLDPVRTAGVHQLHTAHDTSFRCIRLIYRNDVHGPSGIPAGDRGPLPPPDPGGAGSADGPVVRRGARRYPGPMGFRPGTLDGLQTSPTGGQVEYLLARNSVIREFRKGRLSRLDVCDAHPELIRAATNLGRPTGRAVPDLRGVRPRRGDLRLRLEAARRRPVRGHPGRAHPVLAAQGAGRLLRRRGLLRLPVEPPAAHVPGRRRGRRGGPQAAAQPLQGLIRAARAPAGRRRRPAPARAVRWRGSHPYSAGPPADAAGSLRALDGR